MYSKFSYTPTGYFYHSTLNNYCEKGCEIYKRHEEEVQECLSRYITEEGVIKGSDLKEHWFTISHKDVFISHSHNDLYRVQAFAGWLKSCFGLDAFIDACSWGYCDNLLRKIDDKYCYNKKTKTYNYNLRNYTTSHVHMMLATALTEMIDKTECIIFFNTPNSIKMNEELEKIKKQGEKATTTSPWIYHELSMTTILQPQKPKRVESVLEHFDRGIRDYRIPIIEYNVDNVLKKMITLNDEQLIKWSNEWNNISAQQSSSKQPLDVLYKIVEPVSK